MVAWFVERETPGVPTRGLFYPPNRRCRLLSRRRHEVGASTHFIIRVHT